MEKQIEQKNVKQSFGKGWILIIYALICYFISSSVGSSMNVAAGILSQENGWSSTVLTSMISLGSIANVIAGFLFGRLCVKYSAKKLSIICGFIYVVSIMLMGYSTSLWVFALFLIISNGISCAWGYQISPVIIANWFPKRKGIVIGIVTMGIPIGAGLSSVLYNIGYTNWGLKGGFSIFAVIAIIAIGILAFMISDNPEEKGFFPDNDKTMTKEDAERILAEEAKLSENSIWTTKKLLRTPQVWINSFTLGIQLIFASGLMVQIIPRLLELNYDINTAIQMMMACAILSCIGSYICGVLDSKFGPRKAASVTYIFGMVAMFANVSGTHAGVLISLVLIGAVVGGAANWPASLSVEYWGRTDFAKGYGVMQPMIQLIGAIGPAFFAILANVFGSYKYSYLAGAGLMFIGLILFNVLTDPDFVKKEEAKLIK